MSAPLSEQHRAMLEQESGICTDVIAARGYRTITDAAELERLSFSPKQRNVPALLIPIYSPTGEQRLYQARPDTPRMNDKGKPVKYETPAGSQMSLDMHPSVRDKARDPKTPLWITEGIKKGDALVSQGLCTVALIGVWNFRGTNDHGGKAALPEWEFVALNGRDVYIVFDSDVMGKKEVARALERLKAMLEHRGAKVKLVYLPDAADGAKQGVDDYLAADHSVDDLKALATSELKSFGAPRPEIEVTDRHMRDITADALTALEAANDPPMLYLRGTIPARVNGDKIEALTAIALKGRLDRVADFVKVTWKKGEDGEPERIVTPTRPPADVPPDILTQTELPFPRLEEILHAPVFLPDGTLLAEDGYNPEHALLLRLKGLNGLRADMPIAEALGWFEEVYGDFPFVEAAGRAHALAMTLQPFVRPLIQGATPMYLIDAPARGTGKGLIAEVMNLIPLGYVVPTMSQPRDGDELEKRLTSVLLEARPIVFLDNVTRLGSESLHAVLTSETWHGRILGKSETVILPNRAVWLASGNNVDLSDEMTRRIVPIRLDAGMERPEERTGFRHPKLAAWVKEHRGELVSAALSLVQAWIDAGMPQPESKATLGRYESWVEVMGGILEFAGVGGFLGGRERLHSEADKETTEWASFCEAWWSTFGGRAVTASELFEIVKERKLLLDLWGGRSGLAAAQRFGRALTSRRDRVFGGFKLMSAGKDAVTNSNAYRLERVTTQTPETRSTVMKQAETPSETRGDFTGFVPGSEVKPGDNPEARNDVQYDVSKTSTPSYRVSGVSNQPQARDTPPEVEELFRRFKAGEFEGQAMKLPIGRTDNLGKVLEGYFGKARLTDTERHDLLGIAQAVLTQTECEAVGA